MQLNWYKPQVKTIELGVDRGLLFPSTSRGVAWNGLTKIEEKRIGGEPISDYVDGEKVTYDVRSEDLEFTISSYTYPKEFERCVGIVEAVPGVTIAQQDRVPFSFCYRTLIETGGESGKNAHKLHLVYNAVALSPEVAYTSVDEAPQGLIFSWPIVLTPKEVDGYPPTMHVSIDSTRAGELNLKEFERILYGEGNQSPYLMPIDQVIAFFNYDLSILRIEPDEEYGISLLRETEPGDLVGPTNHGIYWQTGNSRLNETPTEGLYDLE